MSGGSLGYLYRQAIGMDSVATTSHLEIAVEYLEKKHSGSRAAINARVVLDGIRNLNGVHESLANVFHAIEWRFSGDVCEEEIDEAVEVYEGSRP